MTLRVFAPILIPKNGQIDGMFYQLGQIECGALAPSAHSAEAAIVCDTPLPAHSVFTTIDAQCADDSVGRGNSTTTFAPHCVRGCDSGVCDAQRVPSPTVDSSPFGAVPPFPSMPRLGACSAQRLLSPSAASHCSEPTCPLPIVDFQAVVCLLCDPSRKPMWAPPALDCLACPGKHVPMGAEELTDNEEYVIDDGTRVVPRNRRDLKKDATPLWHLLTHTPANK